VRFFDRDEAQGKAFTAGTHRTRSPEDTLRAYMPLMPRLGITRLANVTGLDCLGVPVYMSVRPNSRSLSVAQGKGVSLAAAKASALMESIETWHAEHVGLPVRHEPYAMLRERARVIDVDTLPRSPRARFQPDVSMPWVEGYDVLAREPVWVPYEIVSLDMVGPRLFADAFYAGSDGLASGNHLLEAIVHGACELVERDATALWLHAPDDEAAIKAQQLNLSTVDDPWCRTTLDRLAAAAVHVAAWDITSDVDVPAYVCAIFDRPGWRAKGLALGYGAHLAPGVALLRAVTEAAQARLTIIAGSRDDIEPHCYAVPADEHLIEHLARSVADPAPLLDFRLRASQATNSFDGDLERLGEALKRAGLASLVVVDLTHVDVGVPVVKVIVPGLEIENAVRGRRRAHAVAGSEPPA
jgi:ribosomal protein S12 methylthiotransferase accessory factor